MFSVRSLRFLIFYLCFVSARWLDSDEATAMLALKRSLKLPVDIDWSNHDYCSWTEVECDERNKVTRIDISDRGVTRFLPRELHNLKTLRVFKAGNNQLTGIVPQSLTTLGSLRFVSLSGNLLQGPTPKFDSKVQVHMSPGSNSFCLDSPGSSCDPRVTTLLAVIEEFGYTILGKNWKANDPCAWPGIECFEGTIKLISLMSLNLTGKISPKFAELTSVSAIDVSHNFLTGTIPIELTKSKNLVILDVSFNKLQGKVPHFGKLFIDTKGNPEIETANQIHVPPTQTGNNKRPSIVIGVLIGIVVGLVVLIIASIGFHLFWSGDNVEATRCNQFVETDENVVPMHILRASTDDFSDNNVIGRCGFGAVYKGKLEDGIEIAVKRMELSGRGMDEFSSEVDVLHR